MQGNLSRAKPVYGTAASAPKKRRPKKNVRSTGFHIHDLQRPEKRQAGAAPALPAVAEEPAEGAADGEEDESSDEEEEEEKNDKGAAPPAAAVVNDAAPPMEAPAGDPFPYGNPAHEALQLSLEEAFFLMYAMGVLSISDEAGVLTPQTLLFARSVRLTPPPETAHCARVLATLCRVATVLPHHIRRISLLSLARLVRQVGPQARRRVRALPQGARVFSRPVRFSHAPATRWLFSLRYVQARRHHLECGGGDEARAAVAPPAQLGLGAERESSL